MASSRPPFPSQGVSKRERLHHRRHLIGALIKELLGPMRNPQSTSKNRDSLPTTA